MNPSETRLQAPYSMLPFIQDILDGEYDVAWNAPPKPIILDIGANVGGFAAWALGRWPEAHIHCYEPLPDNFALLKSNLGGFDSVTLNNFAIGDPKNTRLHKGRYNCGEASFYDIGGQLPEFVEVETRSPDCLPKADFVKIDTEGSELDILTRMSLDVDVIVLEYHSDEDRRQIDDLLKDFYLVGGRLGSSRGILKYVKTV